MPAAGGRRGEEPPCELGDSRQPRPGPPGIPHETKTHRTSCPRSRGCRRLRCVVCNRCWTAGAVALAGGARVLTGRRGGTRSERNGRRGDAGQGTCAAGCRPRWACRRYLAPRGGAAPLPHKPPHSAWRGPGHDIPAADDIPGLLTGPHGCWRVPPCRIESHCANWLGPRCGFQAVLVLLQR